LEDVKDIGYEINVRLRLQKIPFEEIERKFFMDKGPKAVYTIAEMKEILTREPFALTVDDQALLLARYLIESSEDDFVHLNTTKSQDVSVIKSIFRNFVGSYVILTEETESKLIEEVGGIIHKYEENLKAHYNFLPDAKTKLLSSKQISDGFKHLDIAINPKQLEYLLIRLYEYTMNFKKLEYMKLFELFENEEHKRIKMIIEEFEQGANKEYSYEKGKKGSKNQSYMSNNKSYDKKKSTESSQFKVKEEEYSPDRMPDHSEDYDDN